MEFRSKSCRDGRVQMAAPTSMQDMRSYSVNCSTNPNQLGKEVKIKKGWSSSSKSWSFSDPELQRKKRVASYKVYTMEGKMKGSLRKSFRWIKDTCSRVVYGWSR